MFVLLTTLQREMAVEVGLKCSGNTYLASMLAQPAACAYYDAHAQLEDWFASHAFAGLGLFSEVLLQWMGVCGCATNEGPCDPWAMCPAVGGADSIWMKQYALAVSFATRNTAGVHSPAGFVLDSSPPCDPLFHFLLFHAGGQQPLCPIRPRVPDASGGVQQEEWVRIPDFSLSSQFRSSVPALQVDKSTHAVPINQGHMHKLQSHGLWKEMHCVNKSLRACFDLMRLRFQSSRALQHPCPNATATFVLKVLPTPG